jgi:hypothetical protein
LVYTFVVPIENFPAYSGDWIIWFAERDPKPGNAPLVRAPLPYRKMELVKPPGARTEQRVQLAGILKQDGRLDGLQPVSRVSAAIAAAALEDLASWEFKPASRDNLPVDVDVVIEVPFLMLTPAPSPQP